ncbi:hypothetical protein BGZ94_003768, partial [Podila epigama]
MSAQQDLFAEFELNSVCSFPGGVLHDVGNPVDDNQNSLTAGEFGPILLQDFHLIDKLAHFDRERIPERVVHAKGAGAHGYF